MKRQRTRDFEVVAAEAFTADSKTDFSAQLQKAQDAGADIGIPADLLHRSISHPDAGRLRWVMQPTFFGCDGLDGLLAVKNFDTKLAEGVMLSDTVRSRCSMMIKTQAFVTAYKDSLRR